MEVPVTLETINNGRLSARFNNAIATIMATIDEKDLVGLDRTVSIKIKMKPDKDGYLQVETTCELKMPTTSDSGQAWVTSNLGQPLLACSDLGSGPRQHDLPMIAGGRRLDKKEEEN